jgi:hypothetical protein
MAKETKDTSETASAAATTDQPLLKYEVLVDSVKIGAVIAYRTAQVNLTKAQAEALNSAQPDTVRFLGI